MPASRVTLPAEFVDQTSAMMLLQPEPSYVYAQMAFAANARAELMALDPGALFAASRAPIVSGAAVPSFKDSQLQLGALPVSESISVVAELAQRGVGHTIRINRPIFSGGGYTEAARVVGQSASISNTPIDFGMEQVSITIKRYVGPHASGGSGPAPYGVDRLDSSRAIHSLVGLVGQQLSRDRMKWLDSVLSALFDGASTNVVRAGNVSADASLPSSGEAPMDLELLFRAEEKLQNANIPRFADGRYQAILSPTQMRQLRLDPDYANQAKEDPGYNLVTGGKWVTIGDGIRVAPSTTIQTDTATISGQTIQRGVMFGPGAVGYGIDDACRVAASSDDNYGETGKIIWIAYEGFTILDESFLCSLRSI